MKSDPLPKAKYESQIIVGDVVIPCAVLEDGRRLLTQEGFLKAIGRAAKAKAGQGSSGDAIPVLAAKNLLALVDDDLREMMQKVAFRSLGGRIANGYPAEALPEVCNVYLRARDQGMLHIRQEAVAVKCDMLVRGLAVVGIVALVDEATGYQRDRNNDALAKILRSYISARLTAWVKTFPNEFYKELFRVYNLDYSELTTRRSPFIGRLTRDYIYKRLPTGVIEELEAKNPSDNLGRRKTHHHRHLTQDIGHPELQKQIWRVITILQLTPAGDRTQWKAMVDKISPIPPTVAELLAENPLPPEVDDNEPNT